MAPRTMRGGMARRSAQTSFMCTHLFPDARRLAARHRGVLVSASGRAFCGDLSRLCSTSRAPLLSPLAGGERNRGPEPRTVRDAPPSAGSRQGAVVPPGGAPTPPECGTCVSPARRRRTGRGPGFPRAPSTGTDAASPAPSRFVPPPRRLMKAPLGGRGEEDILVIGIFVKHPVAQISEAQSGASGTASAGLELPPRTYPSASLRSASPPQAGEGRTGVPDLRCATRSLSGTREAKPQD